MYLIRHKTHNNKEILISNIVQEVNSEVNKVN